jgi:hypothetical protein
VHKARVGERLAKAVDAGFLSRVSSGYRGRTAEYQATRPESVLQSGIQSARKGTAPPDAFSTRRTVPIHRWAERKSSRKGTALLDANTEADLISRGTDRDVGIDDKRLDRPAAYGLTVCDCHGFPDCVTLHIHEETA